MSEPIRTTPARRQKLAQALKRNMARRKNRDQESGIRNQEVRVENAFPARRDTGEDSRA